MPQLMVPHRGVGGIQGGHKGFGPLFGSADLRPPGRSLRPALGGWEGPCACLAVLVPGSAPGLVSSLGAKVDSQQRRRA